MTDLSKIDRPPAIEHWARMQHPNVQQTARSLFSFLRGTVTWNYNPTKDVARYYIEDQIERETALKIVKTKGSPLGVPYNVSATNAFFDFVADNPIEGLHVFKGLIEWFPIGPKVAVPIRPLSVTREAGTFAPWFLNPWSSIALDEYQASLYMTALEMSLFRLTDFEDSSGRIVFLPEVEIIDGKKRRKAVVWERGSVPLLSNSEINEQVRIFAESKTVAAKLYQDYLLKKSNQ